MPDGQFIQAELDGVGLGWTDLSDDVLLGIKFSWGIRDNGPTALVASTGVLEFRLNNSDQNSAGLAGYYTPGHPNCRSGWRPRIRIRLVVTYGGVDYVQHFGWLREIKPAPFAFGERVVRCTSLDWMDQAARWELGPIATQIGATPDAVFEAILDASPVQPPSRDVTADSDTYAYALDQGAKASKAMAEFQKLAQSSLGMIGCRKTGAAFYEPRTVRVGATPAFQLDPPQGIEYAAGESQIRNRILGQLTPREVGSAGSVLARLNQVKALAAGAEWTFTLNYVDPAQKAASVGASSVTSPVATTDYLMNAAANGSGADRTADLSIEEETLGGRSARFTVKNNNAATSYITFFRVRGTPLYAYEPVQVEAVDAATLAEGENALSFDLPYQSDENVAQAIVDRIRDQWAGDTGAVKGVSFYVPDSLKDAVLEADISTAVSVIEDEILGLSEAFFINGGEIVFETKDIWRVSYTLAPADVGAFWRLGDAGESELGETTVLGPL